MKLGLGIQSEHLVKFNSIANTRRLTSVVPCLFLIHLQYISLRCSVLLWAPLTALRTTFLCDFTSLYVTALHAVTWRSSYGDSQLSVCQSVAEMSTASPAGAWIMLIIVCSPGGTSVAVVAAAAAAAECWQPAPVPAASQDVGSSAAPVQSGWLIVDVDVAWVCVSKRWW